MLNGIDNCYYNCVSPQIKAKYLRKRERDAVKSSKVWIKLLLLLEMSQQAVANFFCITQKHVRVLLEEYGIIHGCITHP